MLFHTSVNFPKRATICSRSYGSGAFVCCASVGETKPVTNPTRVSSERIFIVSSRRLRIGLSPLQQAPLPDPYTSFEKKLRAICLSFPSLLGRRFAHFAKNLEFVATCLSETAHADRFSKPRTEARPCILVRTKSAENWCQGYEPFGQRTP